VTSAVSSRAPSDRVTFVICTEPGPLERKSVMLVKTLRRFGGRFASCPVLSYSPREGRAPGDDTLDFFGRAGVQPVVAPLNRDFPEYGFANKVFACAHAERERPSDRFVFLDSDTFVLREPAALLADRDDVARLRPVEKRLAGSTGSDENAAYWRSLFEEAGVASPVLVETTLTGERIFGYWNAGVVSGPGRAGFFRHWLDTFRTLIEKDLVHPDGMTFMDQIALALTAHADAYRVRELPPRYNVPVDAHLRAGGEEPEGSPGERHGCPPDEVVIAHYHKIFDRYPLRNPLRDWTRAAGVERLDQIIRDSGFVGLRSYVLHRLHYRLGWDFLAP